MRSTAHQHGYGQANKRDAKPVPRGPASTAHRVKLGLQRSSHDTQKCGCVQRQESASKKRETLTSKILKNANRQERGPKASPNPLQHNSKVRTEMSTTSFALLVAGATPRTHGIGWTDSHVTDSRLPSKCMKKHIRQLHEYLNAHRPVASATRCLMMSSARWHTTQ